MMEMDIIQATPLSTQETSRLAELEQVIKDNMVGFVKVGKALEEIRDNRLYRATHQSFDAYVRDFWDMARRTADQLVAASHVVDNLSAIALKSGDPTLIELLPVNEAQAREYAALEPNEQFAILQMLADEVKNSDKPFKPTAKKIKQTVQQLKGENLNKTIKSVHKKARQLPLDMCSPELREAFDNFLKQISLQHESGWQETDRKTVHSYLWTLIEEVAEAGPKKLEHSGCAMELSDREKLKKAGFRIFEMDAKSLVIKEWQRADVWSVASEHDNHTQLHHAFKELLRDPKSLRA